MRILAIDVGTGTKDIMFYNREKEIENSIKLVLPSPHLTICQKIEKTNSNIYLNGVIMGGGKIKNQLVKHIEKGYKVAAEKLAGKTIRDNLEQVASYGIEIVEDKNNKKYENYTKITLQDVNINKISNIISQYDLNYNFDALAIAVQDHGYNEKMGDRDFRFEKIREKLKKPIKPEEYGFLKEEIPEYYSRMQSVKKSVQLAIKNKNHEKPLLLMDTKFASICGMYYDKSTEGLNSYIVMDIGNGHTTVASIENGKIQGVYEHHTSRLNGEKIDKLNKRLADGTITFEEVHDDDGHGAHVINPISKIEKVIVSGPKRKLIEDTKLDYHYASPGGDVMMTGTIGLIKTIKYKLNQ
ncbi:DUF1786 domain-containing protein [Methanobrevibacter acididurans]|uniref:DUF1786 domain-containing protein n=1 Tax=Methanobrevibacter acididurans TaxID=120963 RepID=UPI0038FC8019